MKEVKPQKAGEEGREQERRNRRDRKEEDDTFFSSRIARPSDYQKIADLCRKAVGQDDYVIRILRETILTRRIFLAFSRKNELIGMSSFEPVIDKSGWLGMARTHPAWRGQGVSQFIQREIARYAMARGIKVLRCIIMSNNRSSIRAATKGGFKPVADVAHVRLHLKRRGGGRRREPHKKKQKISTVFKENQCSYRALNLTFTKSKYTKKMNGYLGYERALVRCGRDVVLSITKKRELFSSKDSSIFFIMTHPKMNDSDLHSEFSLVHGPTRKLLLAIREKANAMNLESAGGFVPFDRRVIEISKRSGFNLDSWGKHLILFEKTIRS